MKILKDREDIIDERYKKQLERTTQIYNAIKLTQEYHQELTKIWDYSPANQCVYQLLNELYKQYGYFATLDITDDTNY